ncbi:hypoxia sensor histidine kinase response regulator DosT [Oerskovia enterophila]|uniref:Hypoxia sensor histidine kinase response regulator DosT n=1 Tax=Oerskovia enterophila TaxID=43678 RepID=A0A163QPZ0_9CELL|nr:hypoxia sensor histidine kinase response regulator DosT [Oerskovia enterophila]OCI30459.1 hypoxia sensor histidine kinase response regulator DosT [Oerskovia enterophila]
MEYLKTHHQWESTVPVLPRPAPVRTSDRLTWVTESLPSAVAHRVLDAVVAITSNLDLDTVLRRIVEAAMDLTGARYGALGVRDGDRLGRFVPVGMEDSEVEAISHWPHGHGLLGEVIRHPHPLRVDKIEGYPAASGYPAGHPPMHSFLGVPIQVRDSVYGNLYLTDKRDGSPFTQDDEAAVRALAAAAGVAVDNARLYEDGRRVAVLEDRERIARDLHDVVIQRIFASAMTLMSTTKHIENEIVRSRVEEAVNDLDDTIREIRSTIFALQATTPPEASLQERLTAAADAVTPALGFAPSVIIESDDSSLVPAEVADQLVVVVGEALTNVARHARASRVDVRLKVTDDAITLSVVDDGIGCEGVDAGDHRGGLHNLATRAEALRGKLAVGPAEAVAREVVGARGTGADAATTGDGSSTAVPTGRGTALVWRIPNA